MLVVLQLTLSSLLVQWTSWELSVGWRVTSIELNSNSKKAIYKEWKEEN